MSLLESLTASGAVLPRPDVRGSTEKKEESDHRQLCISSISPLLSSESDEVSASKAVSVDNSP